jgi:hypothetical protein
MNRHRDAMRDWQPAVLPDWLDWLDDHMYTIQIQLILDRLSKAAIAGTLGVTKDYAYEVACWEKVPHRRHWLKLAELAGWLLRSVDRVAGPAHVMYCGRSAQGISDRVPEQSPVSV